MPIAKVQATAVAAYQGNGTTVIGGTSQGYQRTLTVTAGSLLVARVFIQRESAASDHLTSITDNKSQTWTRRVAKQNSAINGYGWFYVYECPNAGSGSTTVTLNFANSSTDHFVAWDVTEISGAATSSVFDVSDSDDVDGNASSLTTGPVTPTVAKSIVLGGIGARWWWNVNSDNSPPSGYTLDNVASGNSYPQFQTISKVLSASSAQSITWTGPSGQSSSNGAVGVVVVYKEATGGGTGLRVRCLYNSAVNGDTGITAYVWTGAPESVLAKKYTGLTAEASGGVLLIPVTGADFSNGQSVNVLAFNATEGASLITGTVETY